MRLGSPSPLPQALRALEGRNSTTAFETTTAKPSSPMTDVIVTTEFYRTMIVSGNDDDDDDDRGECVAADDDARTDDDNDCDGEKGSSGGDRVSINQLRQNATRPFLDL